jgi:branched-chain amino acid transport system substrate-binding protein
MRPRSITLMATWLGMAVALGSSGCTSWRTPADERAARAGRGRGDVVVAAVWPWDLRKELRFGEGLDLAVDEVNQAGGVNGRRLRLKRVDDHESVDEGRLAAQRIAADPDVVAVIGHLQSYVTVPAAAVYDLSGMVLVSPTATDTELTAHGYRRVFRTTFTDRSIGGQIAQFAGQRGLRRVAIFYIRNTYGRELANAFEERANEVGVTVVARRSYEWSDQVTERTFEPLVQEWKDLPMDAIFLAGEVPSAGYFIAKARAAGLHVPILGGDAMSAPSLMSVSGAAAEGTIVGSVFHPDEPRAEVRRFSAQFTNRYGVAPDAATAVAYDAVRLLAYAMQQAHSSVPDDIAAALHAVRGWPGVTGTFTFDEAGDVVGKHLVKLVVRHGQFEYLPDAASQAAVSIPKSRETRQ